MTLNHVAEQRGKLPSAESQTGVYVFNIAQRVTCAEVVDIVRGNAGSLVEAAAEAKTGIHTAHNSLTGEIFAYSSTEF